MNWTPEAEARLRDYLARPDYVIPKGIGTRDAACSIGAINLSLRDSLTSDIPSCMSDIIGTWIISVQDAMPDEIRNAQEWRDLLPLAAGTGRLHETERMVIVLEWMWDTVLRQFRRYADEAGFQGEWRRMLEKRTQDAVIVAFSAAEDAKIRATVLPSEMDSSSARKYQIGKAGELAGLVVSYTFQSLPRGRLQHVVSAADWLSMFGLEGRVEWIARWTMMDPVGLLRRLINRDHETRHDIDV